MSSRARTSPSEASDRSARSLRDSNVSLSSSFSRRASDFRWSVASGSNLDSWFSYNQNSSLQQLLASSPLGYFSEMKDDELSDLAKSFVTVNFAAGQRISTSAFMYIASGEVDVAIHDEYGGGEETAQHVTKHGGEWFLNPTAVPETDWDPQNYAWFYLKQIQEMIAGEQEEDGDGEVDLSEFTVRKGRSSERTTHNGLGAPPRSLLDRLLGSSAPQPMGGLARPSRSTSFSGGLARLSERVSRATNADERRSLGSVEKKADAHRKTNRIHQLKHQQRVFVRARKEGTLLLLPLKAMKRVCGVSRASFETLRRSLGIHATLGRQLPDYESNLPEPLQEALAQQCLFRSYEPSQLIFTEDTP